MQQIERPKIEVDVPRSCYIIVIVKDASQFEVAVSGTKRTSLLMLLC
jgi:hypothetical protein